MPLIQQWNISPEGVLGIWKISESQSWFEQRLNLDPRELDWVQSIKGQKQRLQWYAARWLLHLLSEREQRGVCLKDQYGKPFLEHSPWHISLSHSHELTAVIASPRLNGVDIQAQVEKIYRIEHKFVHSNEAAFIEKKHHLDYLHLIWGAKECLYKAYGQRGLDFKRHMQIKPFSIEEPKRRFEATLQKGSQTMNFTGHYKLLEGYYLVYALEQK